jgi:subtilisin family serine protease/sulfur relay (sulfurtransferase) complex TusBCD TusD component (DsrE family)
MLPDSDWRRRLALLLSITAALSASSAVPRAQQAPPDGVYVPGELIVQFRSGVSEERRNAVRAARGVVAIRRYDQLRMERIAIPADANPNALASAFAAHPEVEAAQPNFIRRTTSIGSPNDPYFVDGSLWGLTRINAPQAWSTYGTGSETVVVADIDTGVNYTHPDLAANMWRNPGEIPANGADDDQNGYVDDVYGIDTANNDSNPADDHSHGTHTSGTIGAVSDNGLGIAGVANNVRILACKFITSAGTGTDADAIECFNYVVALKQRGVNIRVTSNSWGGFREGSPATALKNAIDAAGDAGILNVFAAGNDGENIDTKPFDPASFTSPSIVTVAASDQSDARASFSNYGTTSVDLAAPGVSILSLYPGGFYISSSGTSMAAPHVAGVAAFLFAHGPDLTVPEAKDALLNSVDRLSQWAAWVATGGRLNAYQAVSVGVIGSPLVALTSPGNGAGFSAPATITVTATASDQDGSITSVGFYSSGSLIGTATTSPYSVEWTGITAGTYTLSAVATDDQGNTSTSSPVTVHVRQLSGGSGLVNVAATAAGATATASSSLSAAFPPSSAINGDRDGLNFGAGGGWHDGTSNAYPDWLQVDFSGSQTISEIDVFSVQDTYTAPATPTETMTFTKYGLTDFETQYWSGDGWQTIPGTIVTGNDLVWRQFVFAPITTSRIRIAVADTQDSYSRIVEVEAWGAAPASGNGPPTITLTTPADGTSFIAPAAFTLAATASDPDGTVSSVSFYSNGSLIGSDTTSPYSVEMTAVPTGSYSLTAVAVDNQGAATTSTATTVNVTHAPPGAGLVNVAAAAAGATATASSSLSAAFPPGGAINGDRQGLNWGAGGGWHDATSNAFPDWLQVDFSGSQTISQINVFSVQDTYTAPATPTETMTFTKYGLTDFEAQYWSGAGWQTIPGTTVTGNSLVWRQLVFAPITTSRIRIAVADAQDSYSRIVEVEAWGSAPVSGNSPPTITLTTPADGASFIAPGAFTVAATAGDADGTVSSVSFYSNGSLIGSRTTSPYSVEVTAVPAGSYSLTAVAVDNQGAATTSPAITVAVSQAPPGAGLVNVAAAAAGATATASSSLSAAFPPSGAINGDRQGLNWGAGGGWNDGTSNAFPDWLQVDFSGSRTISEIDVFSVQDTYAAPAIPTETMTFTKYGLRDFEAQYWNGVAWATIPGTVVTNNDLVWRRLTFTPIITARIRIVTTKALANYSRIVEVEAWGSASDSGNSPPVVTLTTPAEGATFIAPAAITLAATASDPDGTVSSVGFYSSGVLIGTATTGPYSVEWTNVPAGTYALTAVAIDNDGATAVSATINVSVSSTGRPNVAAAAAGATATASSSASAAFPAGGAINGDRKGLGWGAGGGWNDGTANAFPDWLQVNFSGSKTISEIDVFTLQDTYSAPATPTPTMTFTKYGVQDFEVQYWQGNTWRTIPGGVVSGNNLVWRQFTFAPITTSRIRIVVTKALASYSRIVEVEAY